MATMGSKGLMNVYSL